MARRVSIAELKARLSEYIAAAKAGDDVVVTDRGRPVARITALAGTSALDARLGDLIRAGLVRERRGKLKAAFWTTPRVEDPGGRSLELLLTERSDGR